jgi:hypothetical protein
LSELKSSALYSAFFDAVSLCRVVSVSVSDMALQAGKFEEKILAAQQSTPRAIFREFLTSLQDTAAR